MSNNENKSPYYITTAIPYVNAAPHVGFALELVQADVLARYHRQTGSDVRFLSGTDDNSLKNVRAADAQRIPVAELVRGNADQFEELRKWLALSYDDFIRTSSDERHVPGVHKLWAACEERGDLYKATYSGLYCVGCEQYYRESDLTNGLCPEHQKEPEAIEEENYFFRLTSYQDRLHELIESGELRIEPEHYRNEVLRFIARGLADFSVSRSRARAANWGVPVPGDPGQVIYVWFDALGNYISALDYSGDGDLFHRYWATNSRRTHVIGKGITRFHAIYWPAILLSAGLPLPSTIFVHGYLTVDGKKIGKSLGNAVSPKELAQRFGTDALRHYLLHHIRSTQDGDFSIERLVQAHNTELADKLGNLLSRTTALVRRYCDGVVPASGPATERDTQLIEVAGSVGEAVSEALSDFRIHDASAAVWALVDEANRYVEDNAPWHLAKDSSPEGRERLTSVLYNLLETLRVVALHLAPFLPGASARLLQQLGVQDKTAPDDWAWGGLASGTKLPAGPVLFPKIE